MTDWILANKCPHCGGRMNLSVHYALTYDYHIRRDGQPYKQYQKSGEGPIDVVTASCEDCHTYWDGENTIFAIEGVFIRGEGSKN